MNEFRIPLVSLATKLFPEPTMNALRAIFTSSASVRSVEKITQADYDALPTPRPDDVLYVITDQ